MSKLLSALAELRGEFGQILKTGQNQEGLNYKFVEATTLAAQAVPMMSKLGLVMTCVQAEVVDTRKSISEKQHLWTIKTVWQIAHKDDIGESVIVVSFGQGADHADKALPKAQTNAMKYAILMLLQAAGDDPEKDASTDAEVRQPAARQARQAARTVATVDAAIGAAARRQTAAAEVAELIADAELKSFEAGLANQAAAAQAQAFPEGDVRVLPPTPPLASDAQRKMVRARAHEVSLTDAKLKAMGRAVTKKESSLLWTNEDIDQMVVALGNQDFVATFVESEIVPA